LKLYLQILV